MSFRYLEIDQKTNENYAPSLKKIRALYTINWMILCCLCYTFFLFDLFLEARAEILIKISLVFWSILRHQKDIFNWPLVFCTVFVCLRRFVLKRPILELNFSHIFTISTSSGSRHEQCCQMLERLFVIFYNLQIFQGTLYAWSLYHHACGRPSSVPYHGWGLQEVHFNLADL